MRRTLVPVALFAALASAIVLAPLALSDFEAQQAAYVGIYAIALIGLNILTGYTGQISLGHGAFMAVGAYTTAILMVDHGVKDLWTIPIAGVVAGCAGFLFSIPALRLTGLYLALATFAIAVSAPEVIKKFQSFTGGGSGKSLFGSKELTGGISPVHVLGWKLNFNNWLYYLCWTIALVLYIVAWLVLRGRTGRAFRAVRDSETAAMSSGVSLARYKMLAFAFSAAFAGVAGSLYAIANNSVYPDNFMATLSIFLLVGVVVGGLGSLAGLIAGAVFIEFLPMWAQDVSKSPGVPGVIYGAILIGVMFLLPTGAAGLVRRVAMLVRGR